MPRNTTAQQCVGAVAIPDRDIMDVLSTKAPSKEHKALMIEQGFSPETSTVEDQPRDIHC
jgi:hypothetical protein